MRDPFTWSIPLGRLFGIAIRMHILFPVVAAGLVLRAAYQKDVILGTWVDVLSLMALLFLTVLLHEFGHCFGARYVEGDAQEILLWPLGGLAYVDVPHTPRANFITVAAGPGVNALICLLAAGLMVTLSDYRPTWNPFWYPYRQDATGAVELITWSGQAKLVGNTGLIVLARLFWVSWILFLINVLIIGFPLDGGRMFQCLLWPRLGYRRATLAAVMAGFVFTLVIGVVALMFNEIFTLCLAMFIYVTCRQQWLQLEHGYEDSPYGDFSQGYTSYEGDAPAPPKTRKQNFLQRWLQRRAQKRMQREQELRESEERRLDELLEKVQRQGIAALSEEEKRFMKRVSDRYRNRP